MTNIINNIKETEQCNSNESPNELNSTIIKEYDNTKDIQRIRDPFSERPVKDLALKRSVRSSRYRSTAKSRICGMSVGDIRYSFNQLRAAGDKLTSDMVLYNGSTAGSFALSYLIETSNSMRKRRKKRLTVNMASVAYKSFNTMLSEFISNLADVFDDLPELQTANTTLNGLLEMNDEVEMPLETFHSVFGEKSDLIMNKDPELFNQVSLPMVENFDLSKAYGESDEETQGSIWEYLSQLTLIATTVKTLTPEMFSTINSITEDFMKQIHDGSLSEEDASNPAKIIQQLKNNPDLMKKLGEQ